MAMLIKCRSNIDTLKLFLQNLIFFNFLLYFCILFFYLTLPPIVTVRIERKNLIDACNIISPI